LINKQGAKAAKEDAPLEVIDFDDEAEDCAACKL
jgi:hypothetical protein